MRMIWKIAILLVLLAAAGLPYLAKTGNAKVTQELRANPNGETAKRVMLLSFEDRTLPVNYLREADQVFIGVDGPWWRAFDKGAVPVKLLIQGDKLAGMAATVRDDPAYVDDVFSRLRPTVPEWLPDWLNGILVVIQLDD